MIEETAIVLNSDGDRAQVETQRKTTCGACAATNTCGTSVLSKWLGRKRTVLTVSNPIGAKAGERVVLGFPETSLPKASFLLYILPLLSLLVGALSGEWFAAQMNLNSTEPVAIICGLLGLLAGLKWVGVYTSRFDTDQNYQAVILRRVTDVTVNLITR